MIIPSKINNNLFTVGNNMKVPSLNYFIFADTSAFAHYFRPYKAPLLTNTIKLFFFSGPFVCLPDNAKVTLSYKVTYINFVMNQD